MQSREPAAELRAILVRTVQRPALHNLALVLAGAIALASCDSSTADREAAPPTTAQRLPPPSPILADQGPEAALTPIASATAAQSPSASKRTDLPSAPDPELLARYSWIEGDQDKDGTHRVADTLDQRFPSPAGFSRVDLPADGFGAFLRTLPLAPKHTPVSSFSDDTILGPDHPNLAAVAAIDIGSRDLQQCADSIVRLHAEWRFSTGKRDHSYRSASGVALPFARYLRGERIVLVGKQIQWQQKGRRRRANHDALRAYLDSVFAWANTGSLARQAKSVRREQLRPGDFFVMPGGPGHAVLILDVARAEDGRIALLLGQGFMPAQSFHILRPDPSNPWFIIEADDNRGVTTPFWQTFPWSSLHRLDS
ncbi:MAG TPA: hypothetical protein ENK31_08945 [Nannocystis exedens]|nr:hypothetical protein [Nannocystis exedens]